MLSAGYDINDIATGNAAEQAGGRESVLKAIDKFEKSKIHYKSVAGRPFDETLSIIRRWVKKEVGSDENGNTKDCLVIYDYLKIMSASETADRQEYEVLGQQMIDLHNLAKNNYFACSTALAFILVAQFDTTLATPHNFSKTSGSSESKSSLFGNGSPATFEATSKARPPKAGQ